MKGLLVLLMLVAVASLAGAQTHPCDNTAWAEPVLTSGAPYKLQFCAPQSDNIEAAVGFIDGAVFDLLPVTPIGTANTQGLILYETSAFIQVGRGNHLLYLATYNKNLDGLRQRGDLAGPFGFGAVDPAPPPPPPPPPIPVPTAPKPKAIVR